MNYYRYSRWDGSQQLAPFDPEELIEQLSDDLLADGDLRSGLQRMMQMGYRNQSGDRMMGLQQLLERLRQQRQQQLNQFQLNDVLKDIQEKLDEVLRTERSGIERRLNDARERTERGSQPEGSPTSGNQGDDDGQPRGQQDASQEGQQNAGQQAPQQGSRSPQGQRGARSQGSQGQQQGSRAQQGGQGEQGGEPQAGSEAGDQPNGGLDPEQLRRMVEQMAARKQQFLDDLPKDVGGAVKALTDYEFMDPEAQRLFQELLEMLQQQVMQSYFQGMQQGLQNVTPEDVRRTNEMLRELNEMLRERQEGGNPDFQNFMQRFGDFFPPGMQNLDDLVQHLQQLMEGMFQDESMQQELAELAMNLEQLYPMGSMRRQYPFQGDDSLSFAEAMRLMQELQEMDQLEKQLQRARDPNALDQIDAER